MSAEFYVTDFVILFQVVFLHPVHNYALIAYDPSALGAAGASMVRAAELLPGTPYYSHFTHSSLNLVFAGVGLIKFQLEPFLYLALLYSSIACKY